MKNAQGCSLFLVKDTGGKGIKRNQAAPSRCLAQALSSVMPSTLCFTLHIQHLISRSKYMLVSLMPLNYHAHVSRLVNLIIFERSCIKLVELAT